MSIKIKTQRDYLLTEASIELPCELCDLEALMKISRGTGKIVAIYQQGGTVGINVEQRTKIRDAIADEVRKLVGVESKEMNGQ